MQIEQFQIGKNQIIACMNAYSLSLSMEMWRSAAWQCLSCMEHGIGKHVALPSGWNRRQIFFLCIEAPCGWWMERFLPNNKCFVSPHACAVVGLLFFIFPHIAISPAACAYWKRRVWSLAWKNSGSANHWISTICIRIYLNAAMKEIQLQSLFQTLWPLCGASLAQIPMWCDVSDTLSF